MISLAKAAELSFLSQEQILEMAAAGEIALCVHSASWAADWGELDPTDGRFNSREKDPAVVLHDRWLFVNPAYIRQLIEVDGTVEMGLWRSKCDGPIDLFVARPNKPAVGRARLHVRPEDMEKLNSSPDEHVSWEDKIVEMVKQKYWVLWKKGTKPPLSKETRAFIRECFTKLKVGGDLSENKLRDLDSRARPQIIRDHYSKPNSGRKSASRNA